MGDHISAEFNYACGLEKGAAVRIAGIVVGEVERGPY